MSIAASIEQHRTGAASTAAARGVDWRSPAALAMVGVLALAFIALYFRWFLFQHKHSWGSADWSHAYVAPLISGFVIWKSRDALAKLTPQVFWPGLLPMLLGVLSYYFFVIPVPNHMMQGLSMVLALGGLCALLLGPRWIPYLAFPIGYLAFGVKISEMVMLRVTADLQLMASWGSWVLLNTFGLMTERAGNVLVVMTGDGREIPLNVAEACSGMRMLVAFFALGAAVAFLSCAHWWQRVALLALAGPVAIFTNALRVVTLAVVSLWDPDMAAGDAHMAIGVLWLLPAFLLFMGVVWMLKRMVREAGPAASPAKGGAG